MTETIHYKVHSTIERVILLVRIIPCTYALHFFLSVSQQQQATSLFSVCSNRILIAPVITLNKRILTVVLFIKQLSIIFIKGINQPAFVQVGANYATLPITVAVSTTLHYSLTHNIYSVGVFKVRHSFVLHVQNPVPMVLKYF